MKKVIRSAMWLAGAVLHPFHESLKKISVYALTWLVLQPSAAMLFPRAEDTLKQHGLDPKIVEELAPGKKVYVRTDNLAGRMHALLDASLLGAPLKYYTSLREEANAAFVSHHPISINHLTGVCTVYLKPHSYQSEEIYQQVLLHEIRHCSEDNKKLLSYRILSNVHVEGDADYHAIKILSRKNGIPPLETEHFLQRSMIDPARKNHDTALYIDAAFRKATLPSLNEITQANKEAATVYHHILDHLFAKKHKHQNPNFCKKDSKTKEMCNYNFKKQSLSPLAMQRAELFFNAAKKDIMSTPQNNKTHHAPRKRHLKHLHK